MDSAIDIILSQLNYSYRSTLFYLPSRQKEVLLAICNEGVAKNITSRAFTNRYHLSASAVQGALKGLTRDAKNNQEGAILPQNANKI